MRSYLFFLIKAKYRDKENAQYSGYPTVDVWEYGIPNCEFSSEATNTTVVAFRILIEICKP